jgi:predicted fused transcriptional regulator/phosphomethylpyrimidine kinase
MEIKCVKNGLKILENSPEFAQLIPEVRSNLVMARKNATSLNDVAGIPGRISVVHGCPKACADPDYGSSSHMARLILAIKEYDQKKNSALNLKYNPQLVKICEKLGLRVSYYDRREEPSFVKEIEGQTIPWGVESAVKRIKTVPDVIYHKGGWGKEPSLVLIGENAIEVAKTAVCISKLFKAHITE